LPGAAEKNYGEIPIPFEFVRSTIRIARNRRLAAHSATVV